MYQATGYIDIYNICRERILKGELPSGDRLPSIREFAKSCNVSTLTAQRAFAKLQQDGYIRSNGRHGCIVINDWQENSRISAEAKSAGKNRQVMNIGLIVGWSEGDDYTFPPLVSIERILTSRIYDSGGSISRLILRSGKVEELIQAALKTSCRVFFLLAGNPLEIKIINSRLEKEGLHCIAFNGSGVCNDECDTICVDDGWAFKEISKRLVKMGHRKIAFVGLDPKGRGFGWVDQRIKGWKDGINEMGEKASSGSIYLFDDCSDVKDAIKKLRGYTAVVCANDLLAENVISDLRSAGTDVPRDISVSGYDNLPRESVQNELTTVLVPEEKIVSSFISLAQTRMSGSTEIGERAILMVRPIVIPRSSWRSIGSEK
ncbi:MAG TPA: hypothetical protein DET40_15930 [Lentisphaeria bacterium]|nr:MAG: hypothetical protein A2X45_10545 [Lentisphaerae bacterium GWF2_50_93]HCE45030.1 hypothetical protein [Lentisphaeria bacterium]